MDLMEQPLIDVRFLSDAENQFKWFIVVCVLK